MPINKIMFQMYIFIWTIWRLLFSGFLNYVDACAEGLKEVSSTLKVGVPGGSCKDKYVFS